MALGKVLFKNSLSRLLNTIVLFITMVLLTRTLGAADFGVLSLMIANASILNLISSLGISSGITFNLSSKNLGEHEILSVTLIMLLAQLLFTSILELGLHSMNNSFWLLKGYKLMDFLLGICFFISISAIEKYIALFNARQQFLLSNNILLIGNAFQLFILFFYSRRDVYDNYILFVIYILGTLFQAVILIFFYHFLNKTSIKIKVLNRQHFKSTFSYSSLAYVANLLQFVAYRADYWLVDYFKGPTQLGLYSVSVRLAQMFWIIPNLFASIIFPKFAANQTKGNILELLFLIRLVNTLNIIAGLLLFFISTHIVIGVFGKEYIGSVSPFMILLPGIIAFCLTIILAGYFAGINKLKVNLWGTLICLSVIISLDIYFIPRFGIQGAAIASSIGYTISTLYSILVFKKLTRINFNQLIILKKKDLIYLRELMFNYI